jgi:ribokinase
MAVHVVGSINVDIIASVEHLPAPGETVLAHGTARLPGGKGGNQAVAAARMGARTIMVGAVGDDEAGEWMRAQLASFGVDVGDILAIAGERTGTAYIAVDARGENQIIVAPGANVRLPMVDPVATGVLLAQLEVPVAVLAPLFAGSKALRILNAAPPVLAAVEMIGDVDILIVNQHELAVFLSLPETPHMVNEVLGARLLLTRADQVAIVTMGAGGAVAVWPDRHLHIPAAPVVPLDTIGAGDCFCGALAALLDEGVRLEDALPVANTAAALCTLGHGAAPSMPSRAAVDALAEPTAT